MRLLFGAAFWPRECDREWEVLMGILILLLLFNPDLEDDDRSHDSGGADRLLFRSSFFTFPLAEIGHRGSMLW
jgi:hypothetical protein